MQHAPMILLHGAGLGGWVWERVIPHLGEPAETVERSVDVTLAQCIEHVASRLTRPGVIVGHSFAAEIALGVAARYPAKVKAIVLAGGVVPESGKSFMSLLPPPQRWILGMIIRRSRKGVALPAKQVRKGYCNDLDEATTELVLERLAREAPRLYLDALDWSSLPDTTPRHYIKLLNDKSAPPRKQETMIARIRATDVASLNSGHLPMLAQPEELARILNRWC